MGVLALLAFLWNATSKTGMWYLDEIFWWSAYVPMLIYKWISTSIPLQGAVHGVQHRYFCYFYGDIVGSFTYLLLLIFTFCDSFGDVILLDFIVHCTVITISLIYTSVSMFDYTALFIIGTHFLPQMLKRVDEIIAICLVFLACKTFLMCGESVHHTSTLYLYKSMTSVTNCSESVINRWLVYITRDNIRWLSSSKSLERRRIFDISKGTVCGPSQTYEGVDSVPALLCSSPFPTSSTVFEKWYELSWPPTELISTIMRIPGILVGVGHSLSDNRDIEWRTSWSIHELLLAKTLPRWVKQGYWAFKYTVTSKLKRPKRVLDEMPGKTCGRKRLASYHMKTIFYAYLREPTSWVNTCPYRLFISLLKSLRSHLRTGNLSHLFVPECNLFGTIPQEELDRSLHCVNQILADPVLAILKSPQNIYQVYGGSRWSGEPKAVQHILIKLFRDIKAKQLSEEDALVLYNTLEGVDLYRRLKYSKQQVDDTNFGITGRRKLDNLQNKMFDGLRST